MIRRTMRRWRGLFAGLAVVAGFTGAARAGDLMVTRVEPPEAGAPPVLTARGRVVDPNGLPVADAAVRCVRVLLPGHTAVQPAEELVVATDPDGGFGFPGFFRVAGARWLMPGEIAPPSPPFAPGARYLLEIYPPADAPHLFPTAAIAPNTESVDIVLPRPVRHHHFFVETKPDQWVRGPDLPQSSTIYFQAMPLRDQVVSIPIPKEVLRRGGPYPSGRYRVSHWDNADLRFTLGPDTPDTVKIPLPPSTTFRGRVVDGVTGEPPALAAVIAFNGGRKNLNLPAVFDDAFWVAVGQQEPGAVIDPATTEALVKQRFTYAQLAIARPDGGLYPQGRSYESGVGRAAARPRKAPGAPYPVATSSGRRRPKDETDRPGDHPAFCGCFCHRPPRVPRRMAPPRPRQRTPRLGDRGGRHTRWLAAPGARHERKWDGISSTEGWIDGDRTHRVFVPGGIDIRLWVDNSEEELGCDRAPETLRIPPGETHDLGVIRFETLPRVTVRVEGPDGKPVDGVPLRARDMDDGVWQIAQLTDRRGELRVPFNPRTGAVVRVDDVGRNAPRIKIPARTDLAALPSPTLRLTAKQLGTLRSNTD